MLRLLPSDPLYQDWNALLTDYAALLNPACWCNLAGVDVEAAEYKAAVATGCERVAELFEELTR